MIARSGHRFRPNHSEINTSTAKLFSGIFLGLALAVSSFALQTSLPAIQPSAFAAPGINSQINFQGRLLNSNGSTVTDGSHSVVFSLYTVDSAGSNIWTETQSVTTTSGMFRVSLGSVSSLAGVDFNQDNLYLGIKVGTDAEMTPRLRFQAAPYAFNAAKVNGLSISGTAGQLAFFGSGTVTSSSALAWNDTTKALSVTSDLSAAARSTAALVVSQAQNATNNFTGNLIEFSNSDTASDGNVLSIINAGVGTIASLDNTNTAGNGLSIDVQANSTAKYALSVTSNNGATVGLYVRADGNVGIGQSTPASLLHINGATPVLTISNSVGTNQAAGGEIHFREDANNGLSLRYDASTALGGTLYFTDKTSGTSTDIISLVRQGNLYFNPGGASTTANVQIGAGGAGSTTPDLLGLDVKSSTGDPTGFEGAMYYNTFDNKFRCYQLSSWADCVGVGAQNVGFEYVISKVSTTYYAKSNTGLTEYSNSSLETVLESAASTLSGAGGGTIRFQAGTYDFGTAHAAFNTINNIAFVGAGIDATIIQNSTTEAADTEPLSFTNSNRITVRDMTISAGGSARVSSDALDFDQGNYILVEHVKITASRGRGIVADGKDTGATADRGVIRNNIITGTQDNGIVLLAATEWTVTGNKIYDITGHGIQATKASSSAGQPNKKASYNAIIGNDINNAGKDGININSSDHNRIIGNQIRNSANVTASRDGIRLESADSITCDYNIITDNTVTDDQGSKTQRYGINTGSASCNNTTISGNNLEGNLTGRLNDPGTATQYSQYLAGNNILALNNNVGIGTIAPLSKLDVNGGLAVGSYAGTSAAPANGFIVSGKVGIGTGAPLSALDVAGGIAIGSYAATNAAPTNGLIVSGNVGIGNNNPQYALDVTGSGRFSGEVYFASTASSASTTEGTVYYDSDDDQLKVYANGKWQADRSSVTKIVAASNSQNKEKADYVADGTADNVEIQAALDALPAGGGTVVLLEGTFNISTALSLSKDNSKLIGQGNSTLLTRTGSGNIINIKGTSGDRATDITVSDLKVSGPSLVGAQVAGSGIALDYSDRVIINQVQVTAFGSGDDDGAISIRRSTGCKVSDNVLSNSKNGLILGIALSATFPEAEYCSLTSNEVYGNYDDGIHSQQSRHITISSNTVYDNDESGIDILGDNSDTVVGNIIKNNTEAGIELGNSTAEGSPDTAHSVTANVAISNGTHGILLSANTQSSTITGNTVSSNASSGILIGTTLSGKQVIDNLISANTIQSNTDHGILVTGSAHRNVLKNNISTSNGNRGITVATAGGFTPADNVVEGNRLALNTVAQFNDTGIGTIIRMNIGTLADIYFQTAATVDLFTIANTTVGTSTTGVDGLQVAFATSGTTASASNAALQINVTSNNSGTNTTLYGINIGNLSSAEANATEIGLHVGTNWDYSAIFDGKVGVGTATPLSMLDVLGGVAIGSYAGTNAAPTNGLIVSGNVGIGKFDPTYALDVAGAGRFSQEIYIANQASSASTTEGTMYYDSDDDQVKVYANGKWQADRSSVTKIVAASNSQNKEKADYVADGTADNVEIQAAIDALPSSGGSVVLLDGTFNITTAIDLSKDNSKLLGQGNSTLLVKTGTGNAISVVGSSGDRATDIMVSLLKITGPSVVGTQVTGSGIKLDYSDRVSVQKVAVSGFGSLESAGAVEVMRSTKCIVTESYLSASKNGIVTGVATDASGFPWAENCTFSNNHLFGNFDDGGHSQHSRYINWTNNQIYGNGTTGGDSAGIDTLGDESDTIVGNIINGTGTQQKGIEIGNSSSTGQGNPDVGHTISGNIIDSVTVTGIIVGNRSQQITVSGNTIRDSGSHGISVGTGSASREVVDSIIIGNVTTGNVTDGIRLTGYAHRNLIKDNIALNNGNRGMSITVATGTPTSNIVEGNRFASNTVAQFSDAGNDNIVRFNIGTTADISFTGNAPASDMFTISNSTDGVTATDLDGLQIDFATAGTTASAINSGLQINVTSNNSGATTTLYGINIGNLSSAEANAFEVGLHIGTGWDASAVFDGKVGIGTGSSAPAKALEVAGANGSAQLLIRETGGATGSTAELLFKATGNAADAYAKGGIIWEDSGASNARGRLHIVVDTADDAGNATKADAKMTIDDTGLIGIGVTLPTTTLDVNGLIRVRNPQGETTAPTRTNNGEFAFAEVSATARLYAQINGVDVYFNSDGAGDYSEYFKKSDYLETYPIGTITTLDSGRVQKAQPNNSVHGIVSAFGTRNNDDNLDGQRGSDPRYVNVGLLGQLPIIVSNENGSIAAGNQIGTSTQLAGIGAKASTGSRFARALENFAPTNCIAVSALDAINWPTEIRNENSSFNKCWQLPNGIKVGRVMAYYAASTVNTGTQASGVNSQQLDQLLSTFTITDSTVTTAKSLVVNGTLQANNGLTVVGPAEFNGPAIFKALSEFLYTVVFRKEAQFQDHVAFSQDTIGTIKVAKGQDRVEVSFTKPYQDKPVVNANIIDDKITASGLVEQIETDVCAYGDTLEACQVKMQQHLLTGSTRFILTNVEPTGFTILLGNPAPQDYTFSWSAFARAVDGQ